jgi:hypothetical protein
MLILRWTIFCAFFPAMAGHAALPASSYFAIKVVDEQTRRGVPLVELRTVNEIRSFTDSNGLIAFHEPGLMDREVYFHVSSHGYELAPDGFGYRGVRLRTTPGKSAQIALRRVNVAERLYRITGQGIYRDTLLLGREAPLQEPLLNARVLGQDTVMAALYRGKIYWFWGDTQKESYPLGHFATAGATSELPSRGGLDPARGVDLTYFVDADGFSRKLVPLPGEGMIWIHGLTTLNDGSGRERLVSHYARMKSLTERLEHGLVIFNDATDTFERLQEFDLDAPLYPQGQAFKARSNGEDYLYFARPYPFVRVKADWQSFTNQHAYEAFTCLRPGARYDRAAPALDRASDGRLVWAWKKNTAALTGAQQRELIRAGRIKPEEAWIDLRDVETGKAVLAHVGSVQWNEYRGRYIMIAQEIEGAPSFSGEIWYAEAGAPEGPWRRARKIVTHREYTFYNPAHHPFFNQDGGRVIYFEGTYTDEFSGAKDKTPRYNYNQIMYRLDLADPRLAGARVPAPAATPP